MAKSHLPFCEHIIRQGLCMTCDRTTTATFRDEVSRDEYRISGMCQSCQDEVFGGEEEPESDPWDNEWADDDALGSAGWGTDEYYF